MDELTGADETLHSFSIQPNDVHEEG